MRDEKGFTLIEMIIVVAIIGILLGIAAISGRNWLDRYKVEGQTKQLYADLMNARVRAMQKNRTCFVTLAANQYAIYEDSWPSPDGNGNLDPGAGQDRLVTRTTAQYALVSSPTITFTTNGLTSLPTPTTIIDIRCQSTASPASDCIELSLTRILMGKWNGTTCIAQ